MARKLAKKTAKVQKVVKRARDKQAKVSQGSTSAPAQPHSQASSPSQPQPVDSFQPPSGKYFEGVGRRKVAVARVRMYEQPGEFMVNGQPVDRYFDEVIGASAIFTKPFKVTDTQHKFAVSAVVSGSGIRSQLDAVTMGLSRALIEYQPQLRPHLKTEGLLRRDDRMKETRKIGRGGKARRQRQSPKR